jgi:hypothetical protein
LGLTLVEMGMGDEREEQRARGGKGFSLCLSFPLSSLVMESWSLVS